MTTAKVSGDRKQNTFLVEQLYRSPDIARIHSQLTSVSIFNAVLSITTFLGNALILVQCSSQLVFTSSTVQTLASQLYSNRCLFCSDCTASVRDFVGDCGEWTLEHVSVRSSHTFFFFNRSLVRSVSADNKLDQRGQTSRSLVGAEIQIRCNFAESLLDNYWLLRFVHCLFNNQALL